MVNAKSTKGTVAKDKPTPSIIMPIPLSTTSTLGKMSEFQTTDASPGSAVSDRTQKKTNSSEILEEEWIVMKEKMANMKASLTRVSSPGAAKSETQEMMEEYIVHCEKAIKTGKKTDLPKMLQTKLEQLQRARENQALAEANRTPKVAETYPTPNTASSTVTIAKASEQKGNGKTSIPKEMRNGGKEDRRKQSKEQPEAVAISSDEESAPSW